MPEPIKQHGNSFNAMLSYPVANTIARRMCGVVSANAITIINMGVSAVLLYYVYCEPCNVRVIFPLCVLRAFLDILDGAIARRCCEVSELGKKLDKGADVVFATCLIGVFLFNTHRYETYRNPHFWPVFMLVAILMSFGVLESVNTAGVWQDNDQLFKPIIYSCITLLSANC